MIHRGGTVEAGARVVASVVGPGARVGAGATLMGCVLGEGAWVPGGCRPRRRAGAGGHRGRPRVMPGRARIGVVRCRFRPNDPFPCDASVSSRSSWPSRRPSCPRPPPARAIPSRSTAAAAGTGSGCPSGGRTGWRATAGRRRRSSPTSTAAQGHEIAEPPVDIRVALAHGQPAIHLTRRGRAGALVRQASGRRHVGGQDPRRRDVDRAIRGRRVRGARRRRRGGRRQDLGRPGVRPVRHVRRSRRARHGARGRRDVQPRHARVQPDRVRARLLAPVDRAAPVRGVPAGDRRGAEQLAHGGAAGAGRGGADLRALQDPEVRPAADAATAISPTARTTRSTSGGTRRAGSTATGGSRRCARPRGRS